MTAFRLAPTPRFARGNGPSRFLDVALHALVMPRGCRRKCCGQVSAIARKLRLPTLRHLATMRRSCLSPRLFHRVDGRLAASTARQKSCPTYGPLHAGARAHGEPAWYARMYVRFSSRETRGVRGDFGDLPLHKSV